MKIIDNIRKRAKAKQAHIVLPESTDERVIKAGNYLTENDICKISLLKKDDNIRGASEKVNIVDVLDPGLIDEFSLHLRKMRKDKGWDQEQAKEALNDPLYFGACMVAKGYAEGCVAGSVATTGEVIRAAIHSIGLKKDTSIVSSIFLMVLPGGQTLTYGDCGVVPYPDANQLADIAIESGRTHKLLTEQDPITAMLSFSTKGSATHERTELITKALEIAQQKAPQLVIDGEFQFDAAFVPDVAKRKAPQSKVAGNATVFIFPNLDAGNIAYKITERLGGATATGPILQGLAKPMMDLSRGCHWEDIVNASCVAILMEG
ncbi:MAG: phosphate acetyltransferase [Balneolaceae bacterium]|nr:phosphate acetyltransferase [Balneolaceae bacterium]